MGRALPTDLTESHSNCVTEESGYYLYFTQEEMEVGEVQQLDQGHTVTT